MINAKMIGALVAWTLVLGLCSCGKKDDGSTGGLDLSGDVNVSQEVAHSNVQDVLEALGEESSAASLQLGGPEFAEHDLGLFASTVTRKCEEKGDKAVVTIESDIAKDVSVENKVRTFKRSVSGKGEQTRTWSKDGAAVRCHASAKVAAIDWKKIDGLSLAMTFSRSRTSTDTVTNLKKNTSSTRSMSFDATGVRAIAWTQAVAADDTATAVTRKKTITSSVVRTFSVTKKDGAKVDLKLTTDVVAATPLKITVVRTLSSLELQSKTIDSGTISATDKDGGKVESLFTALKVDYSEGNCTPVSGSITNKYYASGSTVASKTLTISFADGVGAVTDENGAETGSIEQNGCDAEDLSSAG